MKGGRGSRGAGGDPVGTNIASCDAREGGRDVPHWVVKEHTSVLLTLGQFFRISELWDMISDCISAQLGVSVSSLLMSSKSFLISVFSGPNTVPGTW